MTRGKIIFIDRDRKIYSTVEFNGDLYPDNNGYGREIVNHFQYGGLNRRTGRGTVLLCATICPNE